MPHTFTDNRGRRWDVTIDAGSLKRLRDLLGVELGDLLGASFVNRLAESPELLVNTLFVLVMDEAEARGVSDEDFGRSLGGDAIADATSAMLDALALFLPKARREVFQKAFAWGFGAGMAAPRN